MKQKESIELLRLGHTALERRVNALERWARAGLRGAPTRELVRELAVRDGVGVDVCDGTWSITVEGEEAWTL